MLPVLRRCRALALALLLAAPGLGGTWLSLAHPCPVDMPWLAQTDHGVHGAQASHGHGDAPAGSSSSCSCVGACHGGGLALISVPVEPATALVLVGWNTSPATPDRDAPARTDSHRHPPATAPPLA